MIPKNFYRSGSINLNLYQTSGINKYQYFAFIPANEMFYFVQDEPETLYGDRYCRVIYKDMIGLIRNQNEYGDFVIVPLSA